MGLAFGQTDVLKKEGSLMNAAMSKKLRWLAFSAAFLGMGFAMPSCPGQQAMQQQIDALTTTNAALTKKVQELDSQVKTLNTDMNSAKEIFNQLNNAIQAQKTALEQLDTAFKASQAKPAPVAKTKATPKAAAKTPLKKKGK
jgi:septal ring factor EnvC (AmiA/AmiB activator)